MLGEEMDRTGYYAAWSSSLQVLLNRMYVIVLYWIGIEINCLDSIRRG